MKTFIVDMWFEPKTIRVSAKNARQAEHKARVKLRNQKLKVKLDKNCGIEATEI